MTAVSTIFGMLPLALGRGDGSEWRAPMGIVSIGGLAASTLLTLLVVPVIYTLVDEAGAWLLARWARLRGVQPASAAPAAPPAAEGSGTGYGSSGVVVPLDSGGSSKSSRKNAASSARPPSPDFR
jgi:HAE1 family hydrophobic/amphiphilic exporter-1